MSIRRIAAAVVATLVISGCGGESGQEEGSPMEAASATGEMSSAATEIAATAQPQTIGDLFPEGEGRIMVLNNCSSCHAVACSAIGQRTQARWSAIQSAHRDRLPGLSEPQLETLFGYLASNFNDTVPEPNVPQAFLAAGCTPQ